MMPRFSDHNEEILHIEFTLDRTIAFNTVSSLREICCDLCPAEEREWARTKMILDLTNEEKTCPICQRTTLSLSEWREEWRWSMPTMDMKDEVEVTRKGL
jgi:hypothetical protein